MLLSLLCAASLASALAASQSTAVQAPRDEPKPAMTAITALLERREAEPDILDLAELSAQLPELEAGGGSVPARLLAAEINGQKFEALPTVGQFRIVGGDLVSPHEFPWQVGLFVAGHPPSAGVFCGGSLIAADWVLTAAHCVDDSTAGTYRIYHGSADLQGNGQVAEIAELRIHPGWNEVSRAHDIALIRLGAPIGLDEDNQTIALPAPEEESSSALYWVSGWGATHESGSMVRRLRKTAVPHINTPLCNSPDFYNGAVSDGMLCAGIGGSDTCHGDSGSALVTQRARPRRQVGIVSWGHGCARPNKPGVYTRVAHYRDWIDAIMQAQP